MFTTPTNLDRAGWAMAAVDIHAMKTGLDRAGEELDTKVGDLLANLMHLCQINELDFDEALANGRMHFEAEIAGEETSTPRYITGEWNHIFAGSKSAQDVRFVFDTSTSKVVALQIRDGANYTAASSDAIADLQESLLTANDEILDSPDEHDMERTVELPAWAVSIVSPA